MFKLFEKEVLTNLTGKVERIGVVANTNVTLSYVLKLQNIPELFEIQVFRNSPDKNILVVTKENDEVTFSYNTKNKIKVQNFKNKSLNLK